MHNYILMGGGRNRGIIEKNVFCFNAIIAKKYTKKSKRVRDRVRSKELMSLIHNDE
jgi:hypothetical protein